MNKIENVKELNNNETFTLTKLNNQQLLLGGSNSLQLASLSNDINSTNQKTASGFKLPTFSTQSTTQQNKAIQKTVEDQNVSIYSMLNTEDGILIGGTFNSVNGQGIKRLVKLKQNGDIDTTFTSGIEGGNVYKIAKYKDGYLIAGTFGAYNAVDTMGLVYLDSTGKIINSYPALDKFIYSEINDVLVLENGTILLGGVFIEQDDSLLTIDLSQPIDEEMVKEYAQGVIALTPNGTVDETMNLKFSNLKNQVYTLKLSSDKKQVYVAGALNLTVDEKLYTGVVRYDTDGTFDSSFQIEELYGTIYSLEELDNQVIITGNFVTARSSTNIRSILVAEKGSGSTIEVNISTNINNVYEVKKIDGKIVMVGDGVFNVEDKVFNKSISLTLN